jgi:hypothetical protein
MLTILAGILINLPREGKEVNAHRLRKKNEVAADFCFYNIIITIWSSVLPEKLIVA